MVSQSFEAVSNNNTNKSLSVTFNMGCLALPFHFWLHASSHSSRFTYCRFVAAAFSLTRSSTIRWRIIPLWRWQSTLRSLESWGFVQRRTPLSTLTDLWTLMGLTHMWVGFAQLQRKCDDPSQYKFN